MIFAAAFILYAWSSGPRGPQSCAAYPARAVTALGLILFAGVGTVRNCWVCNSRTMTRSRDPLLGQHIGVFLVEWGRNHVAAVMITLFLGPFPDDRTSLEHVGALQLLDRIFLMMTGFYVVIASGIW
ncbi:MAG: hypothetical protein CM1200mP20_11250 [Pseudomonadota bacterium]|nr:MAG: hypothetical protein CM1200mP20_11250 [Pseudomonadota bacterium]